MDKEKQEWLKSIGAGEFPEPVRIQGKRGGEREDGKESTDFSIEVYRHYGLDLMGMREKGEEHDWGICEKEKVKELTGNMAGFGMEQSQRIIIDYDKDYGWALVRRYAGRTARPAQD